jgi:hypothetical protein
MGERQSERGGSDGVGLLYEKIVTEDEIFLGVGFKKIISDQ